MSQNPHTTRSHPEALTIVLTGGGSGGHITPLLSLARELRSRSRKIHLIYIGFKGDNLVELKDELKIFDKTYLISAGKFRRYSNESLIRRLLDVKTLILNFRDIFQVYLGIFQARKILKRSRPDVILLKGGFVSVPVAIAAAAQKIPTVTHDSDSTAGLANRIAGKWATIYATGMPVEYYKYPKDKVRYVGIPLDPKIKPVSRSAKLVFKGELQLPKDSRVILITGGGLGSRRMNDLAIEMVPELLNKYPDLYVIHIVGEANLAVVNKTYSSILNQADGARLTIIGFTSLFYKYSAAADVIVTRAGATSLAQFAAQQKACIVIPSPYLTGGHQVKNAGEYAAKSAVINFDEKSTPAQLSAKIDQLLVDHKLRSELADNLGKTANYEAAKKLADVLLDVAAKN